MTPQAGDMLLWKDPNFNRSDYFLVIDVDRASTQPYLLLNLSNGLYERLTGRSFGNSQYWELAA